MILNLRRVLGFVVMLLNFFSSVCLREICGMMFFFMMF